MGNKAKRTLEREAEIAARKKMNAKQIRARARRAGKIVNAELEKLYKPIDEWDDEELAMGRPKAKNGKFAGPKPKWISREIHEEAIRRFQQVVKQKMNVHTVSALTVIEQILANEDTDEDGKPLVSANVKLEAAKFLIEHVLGKPTQRTETDISIQLQAILGAAMVMPKQGEIIDAEIIEEEEVG